jgi:hypothetical protein
MAPPKTGLYMAPPKTGLYMAQYPSGKGEVCKTFMSAFDSHLRLNLIVM